MQAMGFAAARDLLLSRVRPVGSHRIPLENCAGRVLAEDLVAGADVPPFDRSPYDGYALRAADTANAGRDLPVTLSILEEVPAGFVGRCTLTPGTAVKVLTGSPLPEGADAIVPFEDTEFTADTVTVFRPVPMGSNIVRTGEDVRRGTRLAAAGTRIDAGLIGSLAAQNKTCPQVYDVPRVGIISTGAELTEPGQPLLPGMIYNTSRFAFAAALRTEGMEPVCLGTAGDDEEEIATLIREGLSRCDALLLTGGVSVGDYDRTPEAMERCGCEILFRGVDLKPGMACCYGMAGNRPVCALSGNPASAMTNYYAVSLPALRRLCGLSACRPEEIALTLGDPFDKKSRGTRLLRGRLELGSGQAVLRLPPDQGNVVLSSLIGCDAMGIVPAGSGPLPAGTVLKGFRL